MISNQDILPLITKLTSLPPLVMFTTFSKHTIVDVYMNVVANNFWIKKLYGQIHVQNKDKIKSHLEFIESDNNSQFTIEWQDSFLICL